MRRTVELARDADVVMIASARCIHLGSLRGDVSSEIPVHNVHAMASIDRRIYVAAGSPCVLSVHDVTGACLGHTPLSSARAWPRLLPAMASPSLGWNGDEAEVILGDEPLRVRAELGALDLMLPISANRVLAVAKGKLALRDASETRWSTPLPGQAQDAAVVLDGKAAVVATASALHVVAMRDGSLQHRIGLQRARSVRIAARRSAAIVHTIDDHIVLIDLRFGRVVFEHALPHACDEIAIDASGRHVVLRQRLDSTDIVHVETDELSRAPVSTSSPQLTLVDTPSNVPATSPAEATPAPEATVGDPFASDASLACPAVPRRASSELADADQYAALLDRYRELAISQATLAIARAWDEGRLTTSRDSHLPFHREVSGLAGTTRGLAVAEILDAQRRYDDAQEALRDARVALAPRMGAFDVLASDHQLSATATEILFATAAPIAWGELARLYGILANDTARPLVDELLLCALLSDRATPAQIAAELDTSAPLTRSGLVRVASVAPRPFASLTVDPIAMRIIRGAGLSSELQRVARAIPSTRTFAELAIPRGVKEKIVDELGRASAPLRVVARGRLGSGRHALLAAVADCTGRQLGVIDASLIVRDVKAQIDDLRVALERCAIAGMLPCVDGLELLGSEDTHGRELVRNVLRRHHGPLAIRLPWDAEVPLDPGHVCIDLPQMSLGERLFWWRRCLDAHALVVRDLAEITDRFAVGPGIVERVVTEVARSHRDDDDVAARLEHGLRQHIASRLGTTATRVPRLGTWAQVVLPPDILDSLTELIARIKHRRTVFETWGFDDVMSTSRGVTALFQGGPGTGKTLVASAIANELGMELYRVDLSRVMSKWIGKTEQNLAKLFDAAEDGNAIVLFDEADSLFAKRTEVKSSNDRYANLGVNYLLQRLDSFEGIAILTTNFGSSIDGAFKRRLSLRLTFPFPDDEMRERLWRAHLPSRVPLAGPLDLESLARRYRLSGGYIRNCVLRAAFLAVEEHAPLSMLHLERAVQAEFREIGKIADSGVLE